MYKIIGADGKEYGPVSTDQVRQWIGEGRANAQTRILPEGAVDWVTLSALPEFEDVLGRKPDNLPPVGAYSTLPEDVLERDYALDIGGCISRAADLLKTDFGLVFGVTAIYLLIQSAIQGLASIPYVGMVFSIASIFVLAQIQAGTYLVILKTLRGQPSDVGEMFVGFKTAYAQLLLTNLVRGLLTGLAALPGALLLGIPTAIMFGREEVNVLLVVLAVLGFFVLLVPVAYLSTVWAFSLPLVIDKGLGFWKAMETSRKVVNKHWFWVFGLVVIIGLINCLGLLFCCVGVFLTMPLGFAALMYAYESLFSSREAESN